MGGAVVLRARADGSLNNFADELSSWHILTKLIIFWNSIDIGRYLWPGKEEKTRPLQNLDRGKTKSLLNIINRSET